RFDLSRELDKTQRLAVVAHVAVPASAVDRRLHSPRVAIRDWLRGHCREAGTKRGLVDERPRGCCRCVALSVGRKAKRLTSRVIQVSGDQHVIDTRTV